MITVAILINNKPIFTRSARNQSTFDRQGKTKYVTDCNTTIWHNAELGAIPLAKKMLDTINTEKMEKVEAIVLTEKDFDNAVKKANTSSCLSNTCDIVNVKKELGFNNE